MRNNRLLGVIAAVSVGVLPAACDTEQTPEFITMEPEKKAAATLAPAVSDMGGVFAGDWAFLQRHTDALLLQRGDMMVAVVPSMQGRVMTSSLAGMQGDSFGWINRALIASGELQPHMNAFGGEDRFWLGPEGGQYSIYFPPNAPFEFDHWQVPAAIDTMAYEVLDRSDFHVRFGADFNLRNYAGTAFSIGVERTVTLLTREEVLSEPGFDSAQGLRMVAYESRNLLKNTGNRRWVREHGLLSVWILGMYRPSAATTVVIPFDDDATIDAPIVNDAYFGKVPGTNLKVENGVIFFRGDGKLRSKIGIHPARARGIAGSYDGAGKTLTLVTYSAPQSHEGYVNSMWELQDDPYDGDVINSYNDGPPAPGVKPLGPFYEIETSSPAAGLAPGESLRHDHRTIHLQGEPAALDRLARVLLGVGLDAIEAAFQAEAQEQGHGLTPSG